GGGEERLLEGLRGVHPMEPDQAALGLQGVDDQGRVDLRILDQEHPECAAGQGGGGLHGERAFFGDRGPADLNAPWMQKTRWPGGAGVPPTWSGEAGKRRPEPGVRDRATW